MNKANSSIQTNLKSEKIALQVEAETGVVHTFCILSAVMLNFVIFTCLSRFSNSLSG